MRTIALAGALCCLSACSFATMPSAQTVATTNRPCTTNKVDPAVDSSAAVLGGLALLVAVGAIAGAASGDHDDTDSAGIVTGLGLVVAVPSVVVLMGSGSSAKHGYSSAQACEQRKRRPRPRPRPEPASRLRRPVKPL